ncbi:hypothetical protein MXD63_11305 [Frankia sp. Cpl3]|nr:hypothetical protein [Parafrankia colletiae]MCK9900663.1 hypothetical protein [Frankia sp. Cpl3]
MVGVGATLAVVPMQPATAGTTNNPLTAAGTVRCQAGSAESILIAGGGESHGASVGVSGQFSVTFGNPQLPSIATAQVRCDIAGKRTYPTTNFTMYRPTVGQVLNVTLTAL